MFEYKGQCDCGDINCRLTLPNTLSTFHPRQCDCDYCKARNLSYLSDPEGKVVIIHKGEISVEHQGSGQANFLHCLSCKTLIAVTVETENGIKGAINSGVLALANQLLTPLPVSPKLLSKDEKRERWQSLWLEVQLLNISAEEHETLK